jgi:hypothetical protein
VTENTLAVALSPTGRTGFDTPWATAFLRALLANPDFKNTFLNTAADLLNSHFAAKQAVALVDAMEAELLPGMTEHIRRWRANGGTVTQWRERVRVVRTFAQQRTAQVRSHFRSSFALAGTAQVTLNVSDPAAGTIRLNRLLIDTNLAGANALAPYPWTGTYFKGIPITLEARPSPGFRFAQWTGTAGSVTTPELSITPSANVSIVAEFVSLSPEITRVSLLTSNTVGLEFRGFPEEIYWVQTSSDLASWADLTMVTAGADGRGTASVPIAGSGSKRFFRLRAAGPSGYPTAR